MIESDNHLLASLKKMPRASASRSMASNSCSKDQGPDWSPRIDAPMHECAINRTVKTAKTADWSAQAGMVIDTWAAGWLARRERRLSMRVEERTGDEHNVENCGFVAEPGDRDNGLSGLFR